MQHYKSTTDFNTCIYLSKPVQETQKLYYMSLLFCGVRLQSPEYKQKYTTSSTSTLNSIHALFVFKIHGLINLPRRAPPCYHCIATQANILCAHIIRSSTRVGFIMFPRPSICL